MKPSTSDVRGRSMDNKVLEMIERYGFDSKTREFLESRQAMFINGEYIDSEADEWQFQGFGLW